MDTETCAPFFFIVGRILRFSERQSLCFSCCSRRPFGNLMFARVGPGSWSGVDLRRCYRIFVLLLLAGVLVASTVPPVDLPETTFDESTATVNLAPPPHTAFRLVRPVFVRAVGDALVIPDVRLHCTGWVVSSRMLAAEAVPGHRHARSLQDLLCTLLI